jgi:hypothetical protein
MIHVALAGHGFPSYYPLLLIFPLQPAPLYLKETLTNKLILSSFLGILYDAALFYISHNPAK